MCLLDADKREMSKNRVNKGKTTPFDQPEVNILPISCQILGRLSIHGQSLTDTISEHIFNVCNICKKYANIAICDLC